MKYRKSRQREKILDLLKHTDTHPDADWVYGRLKKQIPNLSLGTVYRNLRILVSQGQIQKLPFGSTFDRYDGCISPHYHVICEKCGSVHDFNMAENIDINKMAQSQSSYTIMRHRIDFYGLCEKCSVSPQIAVEINN
jgi:Fur family peroxide stress response transcriptional regulator